MEVKINMQSSPVEVIIAGRVDTTRAAQLEKEISALIKSDANKIAIDFSGLEFISSAGLRQLLLLQKNITTKEGTLTITGLSPEVQEIFDITGFTKIFTII